MIIDRYTKIVLTLIGISLFVISLNPWIAPTKAYAEFDDTDHLMLAGALNNIASAILNLNLIINYYIDLIEYNNLDYIINKDQYDIKFNLRSFLGEKKL